MSINRIQRVNSLIQEELGNIILREIEFPQNTLVTITRVKTSANIFEASILISVLPSDKFKQVIKILNNSIYELQQLLNKRLKMRPMPRIKFMQETETISAGEIEGILEQLKKKNK